MKGFSLFVSIVLCSLFTSFIYAQGTGNNIQNELSKSVSIPSSPEASAFQKYGSVPVNYFTGIPNIGVPIYTHKGLEYDLPIGLTYDASGIKVNQLPTVVGLGWNLNAGGMITRMVSGTADDYNTHTSAAFDSWYEDQVRLPLLDNYTESNPSFATAAQANDYIDYIEKVHTLQYEIEPDMYSINVNGLNETFVIDMATKDALPLKNSNIKIKYNNGAPLTSTSDTISEFEVTSDDGTKYTFEVKETTRHVKDDAETPQYAKSHYYNSAWYLTKIVSPHGKDEYDFIYTANHASRSMEIVALTSHVASPYKDPVDGDIRDDNISYLNTTTTHYGPGHQTPKQSLWKIKHNGELIVKFSFADNVLQGPDTGLTTIDIFKKDNGATQELNKSFDLFYSYFKQTPTTLVSDSQNSERVRLKLDGIDISGTGDVREQYMFEYYDPFDVPVLGSAAQDYLGYYNGQTNNPGLIPTLPPSIYNTTPGANRNPSFNHASNGLISKIHYPNKGYSEFKFESNTVLETFFSDQWQVLDTYAYTTGSVPPYDSTACNKSVAGNDVTPSVGVNNGFEVLSANEGDHRVTIDIAIDSNPSGFPLSQDDLRAYLVKVPSASTTIVWTDLFDSGCNSIGYEIVWENSVAWNELPLSLQTVYLEEGYYKIVTPIYITNRTKTVTVEEIVVGGNVTTTEIPKAGIRIAEIKNYLDDNTLFSTKKYGYDGVEITKMNLFYIINESMFNEGSGNYVDGLYRVHTVHRMTQPLNADKPHIGYRSVTETVLDENGNANYGSTTYEFNIGSSYATKSGNYRRRVSNHSAVSSNFNLDTSVGALEMQSAGASRSENYFENGRTSFYAANGGYLSVDHDLTDRFALIVENSPTEFIVVPTPGIPDGNNNNGYTLLAPPNQHNSGNLKRHLGRLKIKPVYINGYYGRNVKETISENDTPEGIIKTKTEYTYTASNLVRDKTSIVSGTSLTGNQGAADVSYITTTYYPDDLNVTSLINRNMMRVPVKVESRKNTDLLSTRLNIFNSSGLPSKVQTAKGTESLEDRLHFIYELDPNDKDNITQASQENGQPIAYLWGYDYRYPIAKIDNITYSDAVDELGGTSYQTLQALEGSALESKLNQLRSNLATNYPTAEITTYLYEPNIGVTKITDASGLESNYFYDDFHRVQYIKDQDGDIVSEYNYNTLVETQGSSGGGNNDPPTTATGLDHTSISHPDPNISGFNLQVSGLTGGSGNFSFVWEYQISGSGNWVTIATTAINDFDFFYSCLDPAFTNVPIVFRCHIDDIENGIAYDINNITSSSTTTSCTN